MLGLQNIKLVCLRDCLCENASSRERECAFGKPNVFSGERMCRRETEYAVGAETVVSGGRPRICPKENAWKRKRMCFPTIEWAFGEENVFSTARMVVRDRDCIF